jgi:hypothetical protein
MAVTLSKDQYTVLTISRSVLRVIRILKKRYRENQNKHFIFNNFFFSKIVLFMR